jgi:hypothetical protein
MKHNACSLLPTPMLSIASGTKLYKKLALPVHLFVFSTGLTPKLVANSGDTVEIEMITHHAGDDYEKMIQGDPGIEDIYNVSVFCQLPPCFPLCLALDQSTTKPAMPHDPRYRSMRNNLCSGHQMAKRYP